MALAAALGRAGHTPTSIRTNAKVHLGTSEAGPTITRIDLDVEGEVPGIDAASFRSSPRARRKAASSRARWPACKKITLNAKLKLRAERCRRGNGARSSDSLERARGTRAEAAARVARVTTPSSTISTGRRSVARCCARPPGRVRHRSLAAALARPRGRDVAAQREGHAPRPDRVRRRRPGKVAKLKQLLPDATYTTWGRLKTALPRRIARPVANPGRASLVDLHREAAVEKLGVKTGMRVCAARRAERVRRHSRRRCRPKVTFTAKASSRHATCSSRSCAATASWPRSSRALARDVDAPDRLVRLAEEGVRRQVRSRRQRRPRNGPRQPAGSTSRSARSTTPGPASPSSAANNPTITRRRPISDGRFVARARRIAYRLAVDFYEIVRIMTAMRLSRLARARPALCLSPDAADADGQRASRCCRSRSASAPTSRSSAWSTR